MSTPTELIDVSTGPRSSDPRGSERCLVLFTKPAVPGRVKTRLTSSVTPSSITPEQAAQLHRAFVGDAVERLAPGAFDLWVAWALEPDQEPQYDLLPFPLPTIRQRGSDLGERLYNALRQAADCGYSRVAAVGSDHPEISLAAVEEALEAIDEESEVVLGPAGDGGYYLIGTTAAALVPRLFEAIEWSTSAVCRVTLERCAELGISTHILSEGHDVDTPADLERLVARLRDRPDLCPRSTTVLRSWERL